MNRPDLIYLRLHNYMIRDYHEKINLFLSMMNVGKIGIGFLLEDIKIFMGQAEPWLSKGYQIYLAVEICSSAEFG